ncbi:MAG: efflux RND transporter periplasmic adaptor subunit [Bacteroidota bacterium]
MARKILPLLLLSLALAGCAPKTKGLATAKVQRGDIKVTVSETGTIQPLVKVEIKSKVAGQVDKLFVDVGETVKKGQLLIQLDTTDMERSLAQSRADRDIALARYQRLKAGSRPEEIREAEAQLTERRASLERTTADFLRAQAALKANTLTPREAESAKSEHESAQAMFEEAKARLRMLRIGSRIEDIREAKAQLDKAEVSLRAAEDQLSYASIRSPMDGTVIKRGIEAGEMVSPGVSATAQGTSMLTVADLNQLVIQSDLNQIDTGKVEKKQSVEIRIDAAPGKVFSGHVWKVAPAAEKSSDTTSNIQVFPTKTKIDREAIQEAGELLKPGMSADIDIQVQTKKNTLYLPIEAVVRGKGNEGTVTVKPLDPKKKEETRKIKLGVSNDHQLEILEGLSEGDEVLIKPTSSAENAMKF